MERTDEPTCGKGLAAQSALPAKLAALTAATAEVLERHTRALDLSDPAAREEFEAYQALVRRHRAIASDLADLAQRMAGYRDLHMGRHDERVMADPAGQAEAFRRVLAIQRELLALLHAKVEEGERLLG